MDSEEIDVAIIYCDGELFDLSDFVLFWGTLLVVDINLKVHIPQSYCPTCIVESLQGIFVSCTLLFSPLFRFCFLIKQKLEKVQSIIRLM